jgi:hypothetical protein
MLPSKKRAFKWAVALLVVFVLLPGLGILVVKHARRTYRSLPLSELEQRKPFKVEVETIRILQGAGRPFAFIGMRTEAGDRIALGGTEFEPEILIPFARSLNKGVVYEFPKVWLEFKNKTSAGK